MRDVPPAMVRAWAHHLGIPVAEVDPDRLRQQLTQGTIPQVLVSASERHPDATLTVEDERISFVALASRVGAQATVLSGMGVRPGAHVVINAPTSVAMVVGYLAALHLGAVVVLTNPDYTPTELAAVLDRAEPSLLLVHDGFVLAPDVPLLRFGALAAAAEDAPEAPASTVRSDDVALLAFTSGTTGKPKGVPLTHGQLLSSIRAAMLAWRWSSADTLVHALPLFHQHGLSGIHASLVAGSSAVILAKFDPERLIATAAREQATIMFAVPSIHQRLVALDAERLAVLRSLRLITSGSAPLPASVARAFEEKVGTLPLERYGLTETGLNLSNSYAGERVLGTVGSPLPGVEVDLTDPRGRPVGVGEEGEIVLRGPQIFDGYLDDPAATDAAFWAEGWFRTGDLGRWDCEGRLTITGRLKDLVITGGMNVTPTEVEGVVELLPGVREAAVAGLPSETWGEEVAAWVVPDVAGAVDAEQVITHCRRHLAAYKCPKQVFFVEELPRNAMGKITRAALRRPNADA